MLRRRLMMQGGGGGEDFPILVRGVSENDDELLTIFYSKRMCASADIMMKSEAEAVIEFPSNMFNLSTTKNSKVRDFSCLQYFVNLERLGSNCFASYQTGYYFNFNLVCDKINYLGTPWTIYSDFILVAPNRRLVFRADDLVIDPSSLYPFGGANSSAYSYDIHLCGRRVRYANKNLFAMIYGRVGLYLYDTDVNFQTTLAYGWGSRNLLTIYVPFESLDAMKAAYPNNAPMMVGWNPETEGV